MVQIGFEKYMFNWGRWSGPKLNKDLKKKKENIKRKFQIKDE